jgi:hypothetical protein
MVRRISEFKQKLHPNAKLRAWYASHTFGGTTKARNLKILGFSKQNFYYIAGAVGVVVVIAAVAVGIGLRNSFRNAIQRGAQQGLPGQNLVRSSTQTRTRTYYSNGETFLTTETTAFLTTEQRGGGTTQIETTDEQGKKTTLNVSLSLYTDANGYSEQTFIYGTPRVTTSNGKAITTTEFNGLSIGTDESGNTVTSYDQPDPTPGATITGEDGPSATGGPETTDGLVVNIPYTKI